MKKLVCLICICLLIVGGVSVALADVPQQPDSGVTDPQDSGTTPDGGDDGGIGGGGGWPS